MNNVALIIPAFNPPAEFVLYLRELINADVDAIIVVNDGSDASRRPVFEQVQTLPKVVLLHHAVNLGKGAALKTALNHICVHFPSFVGSILANADIAYHADDVSKVSHALQASPNRMVLGYASNGQASWGGNIMRSWFKAFAGTRVVDSQTGLRGIPRGLALAVLKLPTNGYDFDIDVLMACKHLRVPIYDLPIGTIQVQNGVFGRFNPVLDSIRISYMLLRFAVTSLGAALVDNGLFVLAYNHGFGLLQAQIAARVVAVIVNYLAVRKFVFLSNQKHSETFPKYLALVLFSATISFSSISFLHQHMAAEVLLIKISVESLMFIFNFLVQRDLIFTARDLDLRMDNAIPQSNGLAVAGNLELAEGQPELANMVR